MTSRATAANVGPTVTVRVALTLRKRGGRKLVLAPPGQPPDLYHTRVDHTIVRALARAHRWKGLLETGGYATVLELAQAEKINQSYLCRVLRLTLLAPDVVQSILNGRQPLGLQLDALLKPLPSGWGDQISTLQF
jgi:hypothetical protein